MAGRLMLSHQVVQDILRQAAKGLKDIVIDVNVNYSEVSEQFCLLDVTRLSKNGGSEHQQMTSRLKEKTSASKLGQKPSNLGFLSDRDPITRSQAQ